MVHVIFARIMRVVGARLPGAVSALGSGANFDLTDSGGVQEEACVLKVPRISIRENTEMPGWAHRSLCPNRVSTAPVSDNDKDSHENGDQENNERQNLQSSECQGSC